jgi:hypothetical protein
MINTRVLGGSRSQKKIKSMYVITATVIIAKAIGK